MLAVREAEFSGVHGPRVEYLLSNVLGMTAPLTNVVPQDTFGVHFAIVMNMPLGNHRARLPFRGVQHSFGTAQVCRRHDHDCHGSGGEHVAHASHH